MDKYEELKKDEVFVSRLSKMTDPKEIVSLLAEKGIIVSEEEASMAIAQVEENAGNELTDESLEKVSGGVSIGMALLGLAAVIAFARGMMDSSNSKRSCKR